MYIYTHILCIYIYIHIIIIVIIIIIIVVTIICIIGNSMLVLLYASYVRIISMASVGASGRQDILRHIVCLLDKTLISVLNNLNRFELCFELSELFRGELHLWKTIYLATYGVVASCCVNVLFRCCSVFIIMFSSLLCIYCMLLCILQDSLRTVVCLLISTG